MQHRLLEYSSVYWTHEVPADTSRGVRFPGTRIARESKYSPLGEQPSHLSGPMIIILVTCLVSCLAYSTSAILISVPINWFNAAGAWDRFSSSQSEANSNSGEVTQFGFGELLKEMTQKSQVHNCRKITGLGVKMLVVWPLWSEFKSSTPR